MYSFEGEGERERDKERRREIERVYKRIVCYYDVWSSYH